MHAENIHQPKCHHQRQNDISLFTIYNPEHSIPYILKKVNQADHFKLPMAKAYVLM